MRLTPGSGGLAALLTQNRNKLSKGDASAGGNRVARSTRLTPGEGLDGSEITVVGGPTDSQLQSDVTVVQPTPTSGGSDAPRSAVDEGGEKTPPPLVVGGGAPALRPLEAGGEKTPPPASDSGPLTSLDSRSFLRPSASFDTLEVTAVGDAPGSAGDQAGTSAAAGSDTTASAVPSAVDDGPRRPRSLTPGDGKLAALLAQSRAKSPTGRHAVLGEGKVSPTAASSPVVSPSPNVASPNVAPFPGGVRSVRSLTPSAVVSVPQNKGAGFAATLMGLPAPDVDQLRLQADAAAPTTPAPGQVPRAVDEAELTERNLEASGDARRASGLGGAGRFDERFRVTEMLDSVEAPPPRRGPRVAAGLVILAGVGVLAAALLVPRFRKSGTHDAPGPARGEATTVAPLNTGALEATPPAPSTVPPTEPAAAVAAPAATSPTVAAPEEAVAVPPAEPKESAPATEAAAPTPDDPLKDPAKGAGSDPSPTSTAMIAAPEGAPQRKRKGRKRAAPQAELSAPPAESPPAAEPVAKAVAPAEMSPAEPPRAFGKKQRLKSSLGRASRADSSGGAAVVPAEPAKAKASAPIRAVESDPDATLPLTGR